MKSRGVHLQFDGAMVCRICGEAATVRSYSVETIDGFSARRPVEAFHTKSGDVRCEVSIDPVWQVTRRFAESGSTSNGP